MLEHESYDEVVEHRPTHPGLCTAAVCSQLLPAMQGARAFCCATRIKHPSGKPDECSLHPDRLINHGKVRCLQEIVPRAQRYVDAAETARRNKQEALHCEWDQLVFQKIQVRASLLAEADTGNHDAA